MDKDVINRKLESLRRCIARITSKLPITRDELRSNYDLQDIIALNLERAVQTCVDIAAHVMSETEMPPPSTMAEGFARLADRRALMTSRMSPSRGRPPGLAGGICGCKRCH
jgi:uncharacterized protein YutE (UPF0331/DUF86 family)